jgi:hypothetical protein
MTLNTHTLIQKEAGHIHAKIRGGYRDLVCPSNTRIDAEKAVGGPGRNPLAMHNVLDYNGLQILATHIEVEY